MTYDRTIIFENISQTVNPNGSSAVVLVCEHATHFIPDAFQSLGLSPQDCKSHVAWDPGAAAVSNRLSQLLDAVLVNGVVSRLVYDCNRPPSAPSAMPVSSEVIDIPGNQGLSNVDKAARVQKYYEPFRACLADVILKTDNPIIVTIHSFTPTYNGKKRDVEIGILHDSDTRLADALLRSVADHTACIVQRNVPYGPEHGVTHTLIEHAIPAGHLNVMFEIRNDLIATQDQQHAMAKTITTWLIDACHKIDAKGTVQCVA
jgi:predicted N-formylglutamate amidohydrolase